MKKSILNFVFNDARSPLILRIDTTKVGETDSNSFLIPINPNSSYKYNVDWGDGIVTKNHTASAQHTYASAGVYDIKIYGLFPRFYFNNRGDKLKVLEVVSWGTLHYSENQNGAFYGCANLTSIATDNVRMWYNFITSAVRTFEGCSNLTSLPSNMSLNSLVDGRGTFARTGLTVLPDVMFLDSLTTGGGLGIGSESGMFLDTPIIKLPEGMSLSNLIIGYNMFAFSKITHLPASLTLENLEYGNSMFYNNLIDFLPSGMKLNNLIHGGAMFAVNRITDISSLELNNLRFAGSFGYSHGNRYVGMFTNNLITTLPANMTLNKLEEQNSTLGTNPIRQGMFYNNPIQDLGGLRLESLGKSLPGTAGHLMFNNTINVPPEQYSQLLINLNLYNPYNNVKLSMGNVKYNSTAIQARDNLVNSRGWIISDGGLV